MCHALTLRVSCRYAASKGAVLSMTRQCALEYASANIRVNAVCPGTIATPLVKRVLQERGSTEQAAAAAYPMQRIGRPAEVADAVLWLCSDRSSFVTGEFMCVDGGMMARGGWDGAA